MDNQLYSKIMDLDKSSLRLTLTMTLNFAEKGMLTNDSFVKILRDRVGQDEVLDEITRAEISG